MNLFLLASLIVLVVFISYNIKKQAKARSETEQAFWAREHRSNSVRRKSLDNLTYVKIPLETFPTHLLNDNPDVMECIEILEALTSQKIVNLTGWSNTDLKLEYGTANLTVLSEYDQNYTVLVRTLQKWADLLIQNQYQKEAVPLMEFAVATGSDVSRTYYALADYYTSTEQSEEIRRLREAAGNLRSSSRGIIVKHLQKNYS